MKLEINSKKTQILEIKQHTLKQPLGQEEITRDIRKHLEINENENTTYETNGMQ